MNTNQLKYSQNDRVYRNPIPLLCRMNPMRVWHTVPLWRPLVCAVVERRLFAQYPQCVPEGYAIVPSIFNRHIHNFTAIGRKHKKGGGKKLSFTPLKFDELYAYIKFTCVHTHTYAYRRTMIYIIYKCVRRCSYFFVLVKCIIKEKNCFVYYFLNLKSKSNLQHKFCKTMYYRNIVNFRVQATKLIIMLSWPIKLVLMKLNHFSACFEYRRIRRNNL